MKQCSLDHFSESLKPWLDNNYIRSVQVDGNGRITFMFIDGIADTYEITDCDRDHIQQICNDLAQKRHSNKGRLIPGEDLENHPKIDQQSNPP